MSNFGEGQVLSICEHLHANFVLQLCISWSLCCVLQQLSSDAVQCVVSEFQP